VAPLPAFLITAANGMIFGMFWGAVISWTGALLGALTSFYIARLAGEVAADKMIRSQKARDFLRHAGEKRGFWMVLAARLLPFISVDFISYLAGLSGIRVWAFGLATGLGMIPATLAYTLFGRQLPLLEERSPLLLTATSVLILALVAYSLAQMMRKKS